MSTASRESSTPRLVVLGGPLEGQSVTLGDEDLGGDEDLTIGRHASNRLVVPEIAVSRHHAVLARESEGFHLRDLESRHGTFVNGEPIQSRRLDHGDLLAICGSTFLFLERAAEPLDEDSPVRLDDSAFLAQSTMQLEAADGLYLRPENILGLLTPESRRQRVLGLLLRAGSELGSLRRMGELAERLMSLALEAVTAERAALLLSTSGDERFDSMFSVKTGASEPPITVSRTVALRVMRQKVALSSNDVRGENDLRGVASLQATGARSLLCVPLLTAVPVTADDEDTTQSLGVLYLDDRREGAGFNTDDLRLITALAGMVAPAVANLRHLDWVDGERRRLQAESLDHDMIGESQTMARALELIARIAHTDITVLLRGESGTGKELAARAVHRGGERRDRPFVAINCATLSETLLESELFGHEKGAFTGAVARKAGKFEIAHTGSLFLDEVGELPPQLQAKLLRVLQEREIERVGGTHPIPVDVRVIAATNRDLEAAIRDGTFREDLFYRLNVISVPLPPLRQRRGDVPLLASHFAMLHAAKLKRSIPGFSSEARRLMERYKWPGNVRELSNAIERALVLCPDDVVRPEDLPETLLETAKAEELPAGSYHDVVRETKKRLILEAISDSGGSVIEAAKALGLHPNYLHRLIRNLDLRSEL